MPRDPLPERIAEQFSYAGSRADIWRGLDRFLDTERYLNLGYSHWYQPVCLGSSQRRLAVRLGRELAGSLPTTANRRLLDLGCGRGGPAISLANTHGFDVTGVDLVPYNVSRARTNARQTGVQAAFLVGEATALPFRNDSFEACMALDSIVYVPGKTRVFTELARVTGSAGVVGLTDLVVRNDASPSRRSSIDAFAAAWDMPAIKGLDEYLEAVREAGLEIGGVEDISANSIDRFGKWAWLYLAIADSSAGIVDRFLERHDLDADEVTERVRQAHRALPSLAHVLVVANTSE